MSVLPITTLLYLVVISPMLRSHGSAVPQESQSSPTTCNSCCQAQAGVPGVPGLPGGYGPQGPVGPKGEVGQPGVAIKGEKGEVGPSGSLGEPGPGGPPGKVGPVGMHGPSGRDGLDGSPGGRGLKGEKGEAGVLRFSGFTVLKTSPQTDSGVVTFDTVITNAADHYDINTNKFTCQIPGYYMFTFSIGSKDDGGPFVRLIKNGDVVVDAYAYSPSTGTNYRNMATNSALLLLASGDQIWLNNQYSGQTREIFGDSSWKWTTFSGVLLHEA